MSEKKPLIVGLGGSLRERSYSRAALVAALALAEAQGAATELLDLRELALPIYVPDLPIAGYPPEQQAAIGRLIDSCRRADALIWSSPTYHGTVSGVFKNALDFLELTCDDEPPYLTGRAVGLIAVSDARTFGAMMQSVYELRAWLAPTQVAVGGRDFGPDLAVANDRVQRRLGRLASDLISFARLRGSPGG